MSTAYYMKEYELWTWNKSAWKFKGAYHTLLEVDKDTGRLEEPYQVRMFSGRILNQVGEIK